MLSSDDKLNICGPNVKRARLSRSPIMTQERLAVTLQILGWDIDRFGVSKIERGERQVTDKELVMLARALNIDVRILLRQET